MKKAIYFTPLIFCIAISLFAQDLSIPYPDVMSRLNDLRSRQMQFTNELQSVTSINTSTIEKFSNTQSELSREGYFFYDLAGIFRDKIQIPDDYQRELNYALRDNNINAGRIKDISRRLESAGSKNNYGALKDWLLKMVELFIPQLTPVLEMVLAWK